MLTNNNKNFNSEKGTTLYAIVMTTLSACLLFFSAHLKSIWNGQLIDKQDVIITGILILIAITSIIRYNNK